MFKIKVGTSINPDILTCIKESAESIKSLDNLKLGMLFTSRKVDSAKAIHGAREVLGSKPIIGAACSGIITKDGLIDNDIFSGIYGISDDDLIVGLASNESSGEPREIGKKMARAAITNAGIKKVPTHFFMLCNAINEEEYLKGIEDVIGTVPFFGGKVEGNIICNDEIIKNGCAVAFFYSKVEFKNILSGEYNETSDVGVITKIKDDRVLVNINWNPAVKEYAKWAGEEPIEFMGSEIATKSILHPLGVKDPLGSVTRVMQPLICNNDYSITMSNNLALGTAVIKLESSIDDIIKSHAVVLNKLNAKMKKEPTGYFLIESADRIRALKDRKDEVADTIKKTIPNKEFMLVLTNGEYGSCDHSANTCSALSMSFTSFGE